jgi:glycopeptide antibiotics resistance protein
MNIHLNIILFKRWENNGDETKKKGYYYFFVVKCYKHYHMKLIEYIYMICFVSHTSFLLNRSKNVSTDCLTDHQSKTRSESHKVTIITLLV